MDCKQLFARIVQGSKANFDLVLSKQDGTPFDISLYTSGKLVFCNSAGVRTEITLPVPGLTPNAGVIPVNITSTQANDADSCWKDADLELYIGLDAEIFPLDDSFEIIERNCPPVIP